MEQRLIDNIKEHKLEPYLEKIVTVLESEKAFTGSFQLNCFRGGVTSMTTKDSFKANSLKTK